ncbi:MAG: hypothetical protein ABNG98_09240 [Flavobacterium sp.]
MRRNEVVVTVGGYVAVAGGVLTAASQLATRDDDALRQAQDDNDGDE